MLVIRTVIASACLVAALGYDFLDVLSEDAEDVPSSVERLTPIYESDVATGEETASEVFEELRRRADRLEGFLPPLQTALDTAAADAVVSTVDAGGRVSSPPPTVQLRRDPRGLDDVRLLLRMLHAQQHPPKPLCATTRLLVVQFAHESFEGLGSILKLVALGLAQAAFSNRTLVWGLDLSPILEYTRAEWEGGYPTVHGQRLRCDAGGGGGAMNCFFAPLSSCSLADVTWEELRGLGVAGFDDSARVRLLEARRSVAAYHLPAGVLRRGSRWPRHLWAGALALYAFRLQPGLVTAFEARRRALGWAADTACVHVRHGA